ncbi:hypothetical protein BZA70DRAFT_272803 [Myxozyma melibiosi]|uniref:[Histone H3]-lysine(27) N-trimethyltransferase n=1 Tax=Myxozyma melibiosi TaxID=54550 RepID=A0ABR1FDW8_9ASCO
MADQHSFEFQEKAIRREVRLYTIQIRQEHECLASDLLKTSRASAQRAARKIAKSGKPKARGVGDFTPRVPESSRSGSFKFTVESYPKQYYTPPIKKQITESGITIPLVEPLPLYKDFTSLSTCVHVEDDEVLRYWPYFGENGEEAGLNLEEMFEDRTETQAELLRRENSQFLSSRFFEFVANYGLTKQNLVSFYVYNIGSNHIAHKAVLPDTDSFEIDEKKRKLFEEYIKKLDNKLAWRVDLFCRIFKEVTRTSVWEILNLFPASYFIEDKRTALRSSQTSSAYNLDSYSSLLCALCFMHECPWHKSLYVTSCSDGNVKTTSNMPLCNIVNKTTSTRNILPDGISCSPECFLNDPQNTRQSLVKASKWSDEDIALVKMTGKVMLQNSRTSCLLTTIFNKPCREINQKLIELKLTPSHIQEYHKDVASYASVESITAQIFGKRKRKAPTGYPEDCSMSGNHLKRVDLNPCMHSGPCDADCACVDGKVFCEKACGCPPSCPRRYRGCRCTTSRCRTAACECFKWNRECDPDLCRSCGADEILDPKNRDIVENKRYCKNVNLQRGLGKRVIAGPSNVSGWGLFIGEDMKQDEYLGEYKGESISQDEAERRGKIYDKRGVSFLFESTKEQCIDATRAGNKLRFINHSRQNPNCFARIVFVNGVHRIAFFARRRIKEGEELFIDYGYNNKTMKFVPLEYGKTSRN